MEIFLTISVSASKINNINEFNYHEYTLKQGIKDYFYEYKRKRFDREYYRHYFTDRFQHGKIQTLAPL